MLRKWVKILPYSFVMYLSKKFSGDTIHTSELGDCRGWRIDKGEWILWSQSGHFIFQQTFLSFYPFLYCNQILF